MKYFTANNGLFNKKQFEKKKKKKKRLPETVQILQKNVINS